MRILIPVALIVLILLTVPSAAFGAEDGGTRSVFSDGAGNRAIAMGGAFTAVADDASAALWNPGGLGLVNRHEFQAGRYSLYGLDMTESYAAFAVPSWRWGTAALTLRHFGADGIERRDDRNVLLDGGFTDSEMEIALSYGKSFGDETWSVGGSLRMQRQSLAGLSATGIGADAGMLMRPGLAFGSTDPWARRFTLGLSLRNLIEPSLRLDTESVADPTVIRTGLAYRLPFGGTGSALATVDVETSRDVDPKIHGGVEIRVHPLVALRSGLQGGHLTAGAGVHWGDLAVDYAFEDNTLGSIHRLGLALQFGATTSERRMAAIRAEQEVLETRLAEAFTQRQNERTAGLMDAARGSLREAAYQDALDVLAVVRTLDPEHAEARTLETAAWRGEAGRLEREERFTEAGLAYGRALELDPDDGNAAGGVERCRLESDRRAARTEELRRRYAAALDAFGAGELRTARSGFAAILGDNPADTEASVMLGRTETAIGERVADLLGQVDRYVRGGLFTEAETAIASVRDLDPTADGLDRASRALAGARREAERSARAEAEAAQRTRTSSESAATEPTVPARRAITAEERKEIDALFTSGVAALEAGRGDDGVRYLELVRSKDPDHAQAGQYLKQEYLTRGMDRFAGGELEEAIALWEKALIVDPDDTRTQGYLARARQQLSRTREILGDER